MYYAGLLLLALIFSCEMNGLQVNGLTYLNTIKPGEIAQVAISLTSDKDKPEMVDFKLCDYSCNADGQHFYDEVGKQQRSNAKWIELDSHREVVNPGERKEIFLTIKAPEDKTLNGSYWSVLLIEPSDPLQTLVESDQGFQLQIKVRYAYHVVTNIGQPTPSLKIVKKNLEEIEGKKYFAIDVENSGNLFLNPKMSIKLFNKQGKLVKTLETANERLYPGSSSRYTAEAQDLPADKYNVFLLLDNGDGKIFGDSFEI